MGADASKGLLDIAAPPCCSPRSKKQQHDGVFLTYQEGRERNNPWLPKIPWNESDDERAEAAGSAEPNQGDKETPTDTPEPGVVRTPAASPTRPVVDVSDASEPAAAAPLAVFPSLVPTAGTTEAITTEEAALPGSGTASTSPPAPTGAAPDAKADGEPTHHKPVDGSLLPPPPPPMKRPSCNGTTGASHSSASHAPPPSPIPSPHPLSPHY